MAVKGIPLWQQKAAEARAHRDASLAKVEPPLKGVPAAEQLPKNSLELTPQVLTPREIEITEGYTVTELLQVLRERKISVEEVTRAFLRRAALAQATVCSAKSKSLHEKNAMEADDGVELQTNCITELLWDQAIARAKHLDSVPSPQGALFGLPISTKEHLGMVGENVTSNASFTAWVGKPHGSNVLFDSLWAEGCVFFARTTQPQAIMHLETESNVLTLWKGIGGDIGGSIRLPASNTGIYGFKPSTKRISTSGLRAAYLGRDTIAGCPGPMTVSRDGLELLMRVALAAKPWRVDPLVTFKEWISYKFTTPPKVAVQWWDGVVMPHPPMTRALREVAAVCMKAGMEVVDWNCEGLDHGKAWEIVSALYWPDGGKEMLDILEETGEPALPLTKHILHEQASAKNRTCTEMMELNRERDSYRAMYCKAWSATATPTSREVDVILCPPSFGSAPPHEQSRYWGYTSQWNLLDYPGAVFPVTKVDPAVDVKDEGYLPKNDMDRFVWEMYDGEKMKGSPVNLQVVGRRQEEEKVLAALEEIERAMGRK
ncbi:general amidase [Fusarium pseudoanthophilum]|uniref:General amidase n=1 Tax=Fusarium pseudoanthophilum TaxID=48495 RepID=A0A8H5USA8_9HYPO|nr:general amidase [Fusarium pseudoanthophilum]